MRDARLRTLQRTWLETGTVEAEADYLLARVHAGDLDATGLKLAAFFEHPAATVAVHGTLPRALRRRAVLERITRDYEHEQPRIARQARRRMDRCEAGWVAKHEPARLICDLRPFGKQACVRAAIVATRHVVCSGGRGPQRIPLLLDLVERWAIRTSLGVHDEGILRAVVATPTRSHRLCANLGRAVVQPLWREYTLTVVAMCNVIGARKALTRAIRRELLPWALGQEDPVEARIRVRDETAEPIGAVQGP